MEKEILYRILTIFLLIIGYGISGYFRTKANRQGGRLKATNQPSFLIGLRLFALVTFFLPLLSYLIHPTWMTWARLSLPDWVRGLGFALALGMTPIFVWIFNSIGQNIAPSHATRQDHQLVTDGPYRWVRHPLYTSGFVFMLGVALLTAVWVIGLMLLIGFGLLTYRTKFEEANLIEAFGDDYRNYMKQTGRYLPRLLA